MIRIDQALIQEFIDGAFGLPMAHENQAYDATNGAAYAELLVLQNNVTALSMNDSDQTDGVFRVWLRYPTNTGGITAKLKAQEIMDHFRIGMRAFYQGISVVIQNQQRQPAFADNGWYNLIISFGYRANITRIKL